MKKLKICNLLKTTTYLQLGFAILVLAWFLQQVVANYQSASLNSFVLYSIVIGSLLQVSFSIAVIRIMHHYIPYDRTPGKLFNLFFVASSLLNIIVAAALTVLFLFGLKQVFWDSERWMAPQSGPLILLSVVGAYATVAIYTLAGAIKLKNAVMQVHQLQTENWLEELGAPLRTTTHVR
jgi:hypothetical protein